MKKKYIYTDEQLLAAAKIGNSMADIGRILGINENSGTAARNLKKRVKELRISLNFTIGRAWNKGKTALTHPSVKKGAELLKKRHADGEITSWCAGKNKDSDERINSLSKRISETVNNKIEEGTWHVSFSKRKTYEYNGEKFHGTWELRYAKYLDSIGANWVRNKEKFDYVFEGKNRKYTPDFFLVDENVYIEIKGYETEKDRAKWANFPKTLKVLKGKELKEMGIIDSYRNVSK